MSHYSCPIRLKNHNSLPGKDYFGLPDLWLCYRFQHLFLSEEETSGSVVEGLKSAYFNKVYLSRSKVVVICPYKINASVWQTITIVQSYWISFFCIVSKVGYCDCNSIFVAYIHEKGEEQSFPRWDATCDTIVGVKDLVELCPC